MSSDGGCARACVCGGGGGGGQGVGTFSPILLSQKQPPTRGLLVMSALFILCIFNFIILSWTMLWSYNEMTVSICFIFCLCGHSVSHA